MSSSGSTTAKKRKIAAGNRSDPGWEHGSQVDNDTKKVRCEYCSVVRSGGIFRHKHHLAGTGCNVEACLQVPDDVKQKFKAILQSNEEQSSRKKKKLYDIDISKPAEKVLEMLDAVVEQVGEENVVQVVTDNAANYKAAGEKLMEKRTDWWESYGDNCPGLKSFAVRILSLTCSSSGCERNWSAFEMVHTKKRNRLHQQRMNDLVFVMYNLKLKRRQERRASKSIIQQPIILDELQSDDEWIAETEDPVLPRVENG
uniref:BED-type domain-containing protein n=1 Tax=Chenopodium quinoa TaxID=63459 RepID=A0A803LM38_CHEQI